MRPEPRISYLFGFLVLLAPLPLNAQKEIQASTSGTCSPVVTGGSSQITISCSGLSTAKANQLVVLMNRILAERIDLSEVNAKLDQLHADLTAAMNPFANAPPAVTALLKQSDIVLTKCTNFQHEWSQKELDTSENFRAQLAETQSNRPSPTGSVDLKYTQEFSSTYASKLAAFNARLHSLVPDLPPVKDIDLPHSPQEASSYNLAVLALSRQYQNHQNQAGQRSDTRLLQDVQTNWQNCLAFIKSWNDGRLATLGAAPRPHARNDLMTAKVQVDQQESSRYRETLEPQLVAFRDAVSPAVPEFGSGTNYDAVASNTQLGSVCIDLVNLRVAYRTKIAEDLKKASATSQKR